MIERSTVWDPRAGIISKHTTHFFNALSKSEKPYHTNKKGAELVGKSGESSLIDVNETVATNNMAITTIPTQ